MSSSSALLAETTSGALFGAALLLSGVYEPRIITAQMLFTRSQMLQVFLGGSATSALIFDLADRHGVLRKTTRDPATLGLFAFDGNVLGGALIGLGMATTGACPGTALVQLGTGMANGALVVLGGVVGAGMFLTARPFLLERRGDSPTASTSSSPPPPESPRPTAPPSGKPLDIPTALSLQPLSVLLLWIPMCLAVIGLAHHVDRPHAAQYPPSGLVSPVYGGLLIGIAQAATVLLARHHIGASTAYEDVARWIAHKLSFSQRRSKAEPAPSLMTPSLIFAAGIVCAVAVLKQFVLGPRLAASEAFSPSLPSIARAIAGGASMVFGARLAGGCTSGHGISGLSKFSLASLATTAAMFGGGMIVAQILK